MKLRKQVRESLDAPALELLKKFEGPCAVMFRQVATPNHEALRFLRVAKHLKLNPIILEYYGDKFVSAGNPYKRALGKLPIFQQTGADGRDIIHYKTIVDFNANVGHPFADIRCVSGEALIPFHHKLISEIAEFDPLAHCVDATPWFSDNGGTAEGYYEQFLMLFIRDAILFEYFEPGEEEYRFGERVITPAFNRVERRFGMRPLIVELIPASKSARKFWNAYPKTVEAFLK